MHTDGNERAQEIGGPNLVEVTIMAQGGREPEPSLPPDMAVTARAVLAGLRVLGIDAEAVRKAAGLAPARLKLADGLLPPGSLDALWREAFRRAPREELPTEIGLSVPFGTFGPLDLLVSASRDVGTGFRVIAEQFHRFSQDLRIEVEQTREGGRVSIFHRERDSAQRRSCQVRDEFTLAIFLNRFGNGDPLWWPTVTATAWRSRFRVDEVRLTRPAPVHPTRHEALLGTRVLFGCSTAALLVPQPAWELPLPSANALIEDTIRALTPDMGSASGSQRLESAIRTRLSGLLCEGQGSAASVANSLGMSTRTLHRRLGRLGMRYQDVLDRFRENEAERLLTTEGTKLSEIALRLGFSDQSALARAFRRWKGMSPGEWKRQVASQ
jgi:AraC-like DNA-binding protein